jgi:hypothetical protein
MGVLQVNQRGKMPNRFNFKVQNVSRELSQKSTLGLLFTARI